MGLFDNDFFKTALKILPLVAAAAATVATAGAAAPTLAPAAAGTAGATGATAAGATVPSVAAALGESTAPISGAASGGGLLSSLFGAAKTGLNIGNLVKGGTGLIQSTLSGEPDTGVSSRFALPGLGGISNVASSNIPFNPIKEQMGRIQAALPELGSSPKIKETDVSNDLSPELIELIKRLRGI